MRNRVREERRCSDSLCPAAVRRLEVAKKKVSTLGKERGHGKKGETVHCNGENNIPFFSSFVAYLCPFPFHITPPANKSENIS
jgi:hypothetical protein